MQGKNPQIPCLWPWGVLWAPGAALCRRPGSFGKRRESPGVRKLTAPAAGGGQNHENTNRGEKVGGMNVWSKPTERSSWVCLLALFVDTENIWQAWHLAISNLWHARDRFYCENRNLGCVLALPPPNGWSQPTRRVQGGRPTPWGKIPMAGGFLLDGQKKHRMTIVLGLGDQPLEKRLGMRE